MSPEKHLDAVERIHSIALPILYTSHVMIVLAVGTALFLNWVAALAPLLCCLALQAINEVLVYRAQWHLDMAVHQRPTETIDEKE